MDKYLRNLLGLLMALETLEHTIHVRLSGATFMGDHLLAERTYIPIRDQRDTLMEKTVALCGCKCVDPCDMLKRASKWVDGWEKIGDPFSRALAAEQELQSALRETVTKNPTMSLGLDNYLRGLTDAHQDAIYILQQRLR